VPTSAVAIDGRTAKFVSLSVRRRCTAEESEQLVAHLLDDPNAAWYAAKIRQGEFTPWCATVDRAALGGLSTIFVALGSGPGERRASRLTGRPRFLVNEARSFWRDSKGDEVKYRLLESYIEDARAGLLRDRTITLLDQGELHIVDGNKRAIAIYETSETQALRVLVHLLELIE
jgi:hypothetical protein